MNMSGWLYLIKNGDLYKIGITKSLEKRLKQLKPDLVVAKLYSPQFKQLEKEFHKRYRDVRIPQTEYFRLDHVHIREIKKRLSRFYYPKIIVFNILLKSMYLILILFLIVFLIIFLSFNEMKEVLVRSFLWMERISFCLSFFTLLFKSKKYLSLFNEIKYRSTRFCFFISFALCFRYASELIF